MMEEAIVIQINVARNRAMLKFDMDDQQRLEQQYLHRRSLGGRTITTRRLHLSGQL